MKKVNGKSPTPKSLSKTYLRSRISKDYVPIRSKSMIRSSRNPLKKVAPNVQNTIKIKKFINFLTHMEFYRAFENLKNIDQIEAGKF